MNPDPLHPLPADPKRQADPLFRGCEYQAWQTVRAWIDLEADEVLFVEGAEDFDVLAPDSAITTQVKNAGQPISLRSQDVQDAIRHYWELRTVHSGTKVFLRFLTRGPIAEERGAPFGQGIAGLALWMRPTLTDEQCKALVPGFAGRPKAGAGARATLIRITTAATSETNKRKC